MSSASFRSVSARQNEVDPPRIFEAVVEKDYDGLAKIFAENARNGVSSYVSMKARWARQQDSMAKSEEKIDEFLHHSSQRTSSPSSDSTPKNSESPPLVLRELSAFLSGMERQNGCRTTTATKTTESSNCSNGPRDLYRLIWEASSTLADSRPPANLSIYDRSGATTPPMGKENDPPIFDGSVANATPAPHGGVGAWGGSGTILHLACAMDRPLMLAFLLIMGADGRANHTAFRRLMVHEAACNGSIDCLTLLLEMGYKYAKELEEENDRSQDNNNNNSSNSGVPFLPDAMDISSSTNTPRLVTRPPHGRPPHGHAMNLRHFGRATHTVGAGNENEKAKYEDCMPIFREYTRLAKLVNERNLSKLEAARSLLEHAPILDTTRTALIRSCFFGNDSILGHSFLRPFGCADGHGNTPLHWASFKNETECVALLLKYSADPNARAHPSGWTPLHDAAYSNSPACIELLANKGALIDAKANSGATPLCFAAQEDAFEAARLLLERGADLSSRCAGPPNDSGGAQYHYQLPNHPHSRFSGYTPLHYCAHYNAQRASQVLLSHSKAKLAMEVPDLSGRLPIHVAVARGSSDVLRELLHAGARVDIPPNGSPTSVARPSPTSPVAFGLLPAATARQQIIIPTEPGSPNRPRSSSTASTSPVTSPILRSMIPSQPINSSKPWNCLSQQAIDECKELILKSEQSWSPEHHLLFTPNDRKAVMELLRVGKRLEQNGTGIFIDLWPTILRFCGRGWFETEEQKVLLSEDMDNSEEASDSCEANRTLSPSRFDGNNFLALPTLEG